jgi:MurNAc alpha-1-phosphate uridylyltransferase
MRAVPKTAMVLAAGLGTRMRPLTDAVPKPLLEIEGRALLDQAIDRLALVGIETVVVNTHYKAEIVAAHLAGDAARGSRSRTRRICSKPAAACCMRLPARTRCFFVVNSDVLWLDSKDYALTRLAAAFDPERMDAVLLLQRTVTAVGYEAAAIISSIRSARRGGAASARIAPYLFSGIQLLHRRALTASAAWPAFRST